MNKKRFEDVKASLKERGYKVYSQHWHKEDYVLGKSFHKDDNRWEAERPAYQILLSVYDYAAKNFFELEKHDVSIGVHIDVSRTYQENMELYFHWDADTTIEEVERMAESFFSWVVVSEENKKA